EATGEGAHVTLDLAGGDYLAVDVNAAARLGRIVLIGMMAGPTTTLSAATVLAKRLTIVGTMLRPRSVEQKTQATRGFERDVVPLLARGTVRPVIDELIPLADATRAYDLVASNATFGKVVLDCT